MSASLVDNQLEKIDFMFNSIETILRNSEQNKKISMENEMTGLLSITISAIYENCIKFIMEQYALCFHEKFNFHVKESYEKLNSKIRIENLKSYIKALSGDKDKFENYLLIINKRYNEKIESKYEQILTHRHRFAHSNINSTTINELKNCFNFSKHVIYAFEYSLIGNIKSEFLKSLRQKINYLKPMYLASKVIISSFQQRVTSLQEHYLHLECKDILLSIENSLLKLEEIFKKVKLLSLSLDQLGKLEEYEQEIKIQYKIIPEGKSEIINKLKK